MSATNLHFEATQEPEGLAKVKMITEEVCKETRRDGKYILCFFGYFVLKIEHVLFSSFLLLWVTSFVDDGLLSEDESKKCYESMILISTVVSGLLLPLFGYLGDALSSRVLVPLAYTFRAVCGFSFMFLEDPRSNLAYIVVIMLTCATMIEGISINVLFFRGIPSVVRGTMMGVYTCFGQLGMLFFTLAGGQMFDRINRNSPFFGLAALDSLVVILALVMAFLRIFR